MLSAQQSDKREIGMAGVADEIVIGVDVKTLDAAYFRGEGRTKRTQNKKGTNALGGKYEHIHEVVHEEGKEIQQDKGKRVTLICMLCLALGTVFVSCDSTCNPSNMWKQHVGGVRGKKPSAQTEQTHLDAYAKGSLSTSGGGTQTVFTATADGQLHLQSIGHYAPDIQAIIDKKLARWIASCGHPMSIVKEPEFRSFIYEATRGKYIPPYPSKLNNLILEDGGHVRRRIEEALAAAILFHGNMPFITLYLVGRVYGGK